MLSAKKCENCHYGMLMPKLTQLHHKLQKMQINALQLWELDMSDVMVKEAVLSAVAHPQYKLKWLLSEKTDSITQLFLNLFASVYHPLYLQLCLLALKLMMTMVIMIKCQQLSHSSEQDTVMQYLADTDTHLNSLYKYDDVKRMFLRYNVALPSSTPLESLLVLLDL